RGRALLVDDDAAFCETIALGLRRRGFEVATSTSPRAALERLIEYDPHVLLTDLNMREMDGTELCAQARQRVPHLPVVVLTAFGSLDTAVRAIRAGAYDFVTKPIELDALELALDRAIEHRRLNDEVTRLRVEVRSHAGFGELLGESEPMRQLFDLLERIAPSISTVLISGESGTGKELVARALHDRGPRRNGPFVAINCAALPEPLLESELFGHARGAFTDARASRAGLLVQADRGTLFLDEVGEMPLSMQAKLLRVLQDRAVRPVGGESEIPFDARIVAATNRDLAQSVEQGQFREDLYFRLAVIPIDLPPLRSRGNDVLLLAQHLLERFAARAGKSIGGIDPEAARRLLSYRWPGNVRELANSVERAVALAHHDRITVDDLPPRVAQPSSAPSAPGGDALVPLEEVERRYVMQVLDAVGGHRGRAAEILGIDRKTLYRKLEQWKG
ncbi:MAG: sigma-54 dependent transcriptional regulator, partial [Sandaracinaceae bacterium]|nr:sigma-54 dependent transcriptional regulator [Sandaracinaceae bacterium]